MNQHDNTTMVESQRHSTFLIGTVETGTPKALRWPRTI
jgi:hypothetical protein